MCIYGVMAGVFTFSRVVFIFVFIVVSPSINFTDYVINNILPLSDSHAGLLRNVTVTVVSNCASLRVSWRTRPPSAGAPVYINCAYVSPALFSLTDRRLLFAGRQRSVYRPSSSFSSSAVLVAVLLLLGGVEPNPGPAGLRLGLVNARSAVTKAALIHDIISHHHLDILAVTETWMRADLPPAIVDDIAPPDYAVIHRYRPCGQGGGVAVVYRRGLKLSMLTVTTECRTFECLTVKLSTAGRRLNLGAIYRPPSSSAFGVPVGEFCADFTDFLDEFLMLPGEPLLCGDFNCPGGAGTVDNQLSEVLTDRSLLQAVDQPTHLAGNILDLVITSIDAELACNVSVEDVGLSDHSLVAVDLNLRHARPNTRQLKYRNIKAVDPAEFARLLGLEKICTCPPVDTDAFADELDASVTRVLNVLAPIRSRSVRIGKRSAKWLSLRAVDAKRRRRRLERRWRRTHAEADRVAYRVCCREANLEINRSREAFFHERLTTAGTDQKARWRVVRELLHTDDRREEPTSEQAQRLCADFSSFFSGKLHRVADEVAARLSTAPPISNPPPSQPSLVQMFSLHYVDTEEVARLIRSAPPKTSPLDCMPTSLLKATVDVLAPLLAQLANLSFTSGVFPSRYKLGHVTPLLKKPSLSKDDPANYRPITNLCTFSKILERLALRRLQPHVLASGNYSKYQSAYRAGYSTETALLKIANDIRMAAGEGRCTALLALDISAAFDAVNHSILCQRLQHTFGINGSVLDWLGSFVSGRSQYVAAGGERSDTAPCESGVPQGSVLGPLLFSLYVAPVSDIAAAHHVSIHQYADDIQTYIAFQPRCLDSLSQLINCTDDITHWFLENGLLLNPSKTEAVVFGTASRLRSTDITGGVTVAGSSLQFSDTVKLLGVELDQALSMDRHVSSVVSSCNFHIRALRHIRPRLTLDAAKCVAVSIIGARLDYCNSLLHGTSQRNLDRLQRVQNSLARVVTQAPPRSSATELRRQLHWLPIRQRVHFKLGTITFRAIHTGTPTYLASELHRHQPPRALRSGTTTTLHRPHATSDFHQDSFAVSAPATWNNLPAAIRDSSSLDTFKTALKTHLFNSVYTPRH